jgi:hypothetical protein
VAKGLKLHLQLPWDPIRSNPRTVPKKTPQKNEFRTSMHGGLVVSKQAIFKHHPSLAVYCCPGGALAVGEGEPREYHVGLKRVEDGGLACVG